MIEKTFKRFNMTEANISKTPLIKGYQVEIKETIDVPYRQLIRCLMFISTVSRPDISYASSFLSQYLDKPTQSLWVEQREY